MFLLQPLVPFKQRFQPIKLFCHANLLLASSQNSTFKDAVQALKHGNFFF